MKHNIIVSHPGKQYVHRLVYALQNKHLLKKFYTTAWQKKSNPLFSAVLGTPMLGQILQRLIDKRYFAPLDEKYISVNFLPEIQRFLKEKAGISRHLNTWQLNRNHDARIANKLKNIDFDILIGYEMASLASFKQVNKLGKFCILDLAQVHYNKIEELASCYEFFARSLPNKKLRTKINSVKEEELQLAGSILTLSHFAKNTLIQNQIAKEKIKEINLGFDPINFTPKLGYQGAKKLKVLFASTITQRKGIHLLLEAIKIIGLDHVSLTVIGPIADGQDILKKYEKYFTYYSFLPHEELVRFYQDADVLVLPSYLDSWAMVVLEAMACGTPVIVSENTGSAQVIDEHGGGFVIPVNSANSIVEKLSFFIENKDSLEVMGKQAIESAQKYTWNRYEAEVSELMLNLLHDKN